MDAYSTDRFVAAVVPYVKKHGATQHLADLLGKAGLDVGQALEMATMDRPLRRLRTLVQNHLERFSTQKMETIDELFRCLGLPKLTAHAEHRAQQRTLRRRVEGVIERRHEIVHRRDLDKYGRPQEVSALWALRRINNLDLLVAHADEIILNSWAPQRRQSARR